MFPTVPLKTTGTLLLRLPFSFLRQCSSWNAQGLAVITTLSPGGWVIRPVAYSIWYKGVGTSAVVPPRLQVPASSWALLHITWSPIKSMSQRRAPGCLYLFSSLWLSLVKGISLHWTTEEWLPKLCQVLSYPGGICITFISLYILPYLITHPSGIIVHLPF